MKYYLFHAHQGKGSGLVKPAPFEYHRAQSLDDCLQLLAERAPDVKILAGGQSLVPLMNLRLARPEAVVDVNGLVDLAYRHRYEDVVELGALMRHTDVAASEEVISSVPLLAEAARLIGYPAIRNRGTLGGSLAHADPAAELPCACVALGAEIVVRGPEGERRIPAAEFFLSHFTTALTPSEMIVALRVPVRQPGEGSAFEELARKTGDFAVVAVAAVLSLSGGAVDRAALSVAGLAGRPTRLPEAEAALVGHQPSEELFAAAGAIVTSEVAPGRASEQDDFRATVAGVLTTRALGKASRRAAGGDETDAI